MQGGYPPSSSGFCVLPGPKEHIYRNNWNLIPTEK